MKSGWGKAFWGRMAMIMGLVFLFMVPQGMCGQTLHVGEGLDPNLPGNYNTIAAALSDAVDGDVIRVESGVYNENITIPEGVILIGSGNETNINSVRLRSRTAFGNCYVRYATVIGQPTTFVNLFIEQRLDTIAIYEKVHIENCIINQGILGYDNNRYRIQNSVIINSTIGSEVICLGGMYFSGNKIHISEGKFLSIGENCIFRNNLIVLGLPAHNHTYNASSTVFEHNTIIKPSDLPVPHQLWKNNIIYSDTDPVIDTNGNLVGRPGFVDFANADYHLTADAAARDAGIGIDADDPYADIGMYGGVFANIWENVVPEAGKPSVGHIVVTPNPVVPGEPLRLRFTAQSNP